MCIRDRDGAVLLKSLADETEGNFTFEYSPESFPGTEVDYAVEVCNAVLDVWKPSPEKKVIINIPTTVQIAMPHVFASQVEYIHKNLKYRDSVVLSEMCIRDSTTPFPQRVYLTWYKLLL